MGKLQVRRGNKADLPNPLDNGEFGWTEDTKQLYIGTGIANANVFIGGTPASADYKIYLATSALGGRALSTGATGLLIEDGTTTATTANKLVNGNATFTDALIDKTVYNTTDGTWAKITAVDSATTLSLSADIMASGEDYDIADALSDLEEAYSILPSSFTVNITLAISNGTFTYAGAVSLAGKTATGAAVLYMQGVPAATTIESTTDTTLTLGDAITVNDVTFSDPVIYGSDSNLIDCDFASNLTANAVIALDNTDVDGNIVAFDSFTNTNGITVGGNMTVYGPCNLDTAAITGYLTTYDTLDNTVSLDVTGNFTAWGVTNTVDLSVGGDFYAATTFTCSTDLDVTGDLECDGVTTVEGTITVGGTMEVNGSWIQTDSLDVTGNLTSYGEVITSNLTVGGNLETRANFTQTGTLDVTGTWYSYGISICQDITIGGVAEFVGKLYLTGTTNTFNGMVTYRERFEVLNATFNKNVYSRFGGDGVWDTCTITSPYKLFIYTGSANRFESGTYTIGNDPQNVTNIAATITTGYTMYVASSTYGGTAGGDGLEIVSGTTTGTTANKLVDSGANFTEAEHLNKTVYNSTDDTWAKVSAVDSATQLSLSADIMASGEDYKIVNAISTITLAVAAIPGQYNCNTTIKVSPETFREQVTIEGKTPSGAFQIYFYGTMVLAYSGTFTSTPVHLAANGEGSWGTWADTGASFTTSSGTPNTGGYVGYLLRTVTASQTLERIIDALPTSTTGRICGLWSKFTGGTHSADIPANGAAYKILSFGTRVTGADAGADTTAVRDHAFLVKSKGVNFHHLLINYTAIDCIRFDSGSVNNNVSSCKIHEPTASGVGGGCIRLRPGASCDRISSIWGYSSITTARGIRCEGGFIGTIDNIRLTTFQNAGIAVESNGNCNTITFVGIYNCLNGVVATFGGNVFLRTASFIYASTSHNLSANYNSIFFSSTATVIGTLANTEIKNAGGYGCRITDLSRGVASGFTYTTNTSGTYSADATTFGYVS